jgi:hypothetical protein
MDLILEDRGRRLSCKTYPTLGNQSLEEIRERAQVQKRLELHAVRH